MAGSGSWAFQDKFNKEMERRGVPVVRYADDIVVLAKSPRAAERLLESSRRYLEGKLKLKMNLDKSRAVSVYSVRNFKFLGFALGKNTLKSWDEWLRRRFRMYIWKQWKVPKARIRNLMKLGIPKYYAHKWGYTKGYWRVAGSPVLTRSITNERLAQAGYFSLSGKYESLHLCG